MIGSSQEWNPLGEQNSRSLHSRKFAKRENQTLISDLDPSSLKTRLPNRLIMWDFETPHFEALADRKILSGTNDSFRPKEHDLKIGRDRQSITIAGLNHINQSNRIPRVASSRKWRKISGHWHQSLFALVATIISTITSERAENSYGF